MPSSTKPVQTSSVLLWVLHSSPLEQVEEAVPVYDACSESAHCSLWGGLGVSNRWMALAPDESLASLVQHAAAL